MSTEERPDVEKFMTDPKFQGDREFFRALNKRLLEDEMKASRQKIAEKKKPETVFDFIFGVPNPEDGEPVSIFDRLFGR